LFFSQSNKQNWNWRSHNMCISWYDFKAFGIYRNNKTSSINYYFKEISRYVWHQTEQFSPHQHNAFTWYCTITCCICPHAAAFGIFCSVDPWMCSLHCQWWRKNRIRSESVRSPYTTAGYSIIWVEDKVFVK